MAVKYWLGAATAVQQINTYTFGGTWATGDKATLDLGGTAVTLTVGVATTTADVAAAFNAMLNGTNATPGLIGTETRTANAQSTAKFQQISSTVSSSVVTVKGTAGWDVTLTSSKVSTSGTITPAVVQAATGPNHLDNAANYSGGTLPSDGDKVIPLRGAGAIYFGLGYFRTNTIGLDWDFTGDFYSGVGLPEVNETWGYAEYLPRPLQLYGASKTIRFLPGTNSITTHADIFLDLQGVTGSTLTSDHARGPSTRWGEPNVFCYGGGNGASTAFGNITITKGQIYFDKGDIAIASGYDLLPATVKIGARGAASGECTVFVGAGVRADDAVGWQQIGGTCHLYAPTKIGSDEVDVYLYGGQCYFAAAGGYADIHVYSGATAYLISGTSLVLMALYGGATLDCDQGSPSCPLTDLKIYAGATVIDHSGFCVVGFDLVGCGLADVTLTLPQNRAFDISAAAVPA